MSVYAPEAPYNIVCSDCWWKDDWDPLDYGQDYDFDRSFFEQFAELQKEVPLPSMNRLNNTLVNSEYTNQTSYLKNCYL